VFLHTREDIERTIKYIERNPAGIGEPRQVWPFVSPYAGWLPGQVRVVPKVTPRPTDRAATPAKHADRRGRNQDRE
jgi:hypothetical protein